jgi:hypothetical protein
MERWNLQDTNFLVEHAGIEKNREAANIGAISWLTVALFLVIINHINCKNADPGGRAI